MNKTIFMYKAFKGAICFTLTLALIAGSAVVAPKRVDAGIGATIGLKVVSFGVGLIDKGVVKGLQYAAEATGNDTFGKIADFVTLPSSKDASQIKQMCEEILETLNQMSHDMSAMNQAIEQSIAHLQTTVDATNLSSSNRRIGSSVQSCTIIIENYRLYINKALAYAETVEAYQKTPTDAAEKKMNNAAAAVKAALSEFEKAGKGVNFDEVIKNAASDSCRLYPYYDGKVDEGRDLTNADTNIDYASEWADGVYAFEHQKYPFMKDIMNWTAFGFTNIMVANSLWVDYQEEGSAEEAEALLVQEKVQHKVMQAINDIATQCDAYTKTLMRPYDVERTVEMDYNASQDYNETREIVDMVTGTSGTYFLNTTLKPAHTAPELAFYHVKAIGKERPVLILKNNINSKMPGYGYNGPRDGRTFIKAGKAAGVLVTITFPPCPIPFYADYTTMNMDFFNLLSTKDHTYFMPSDTSQISDVINTRSYSLAGSDMWKYLTERGGLSPSNLLRNMAVTPLSKWEEAGTQFSQFCSFNCHYYFTSIKGYNPSAPHISELHFRGNHPSNEDMLVLLIGRNDLIKYRTYNEATQGVSIKIAGDVARKDYIPGTQQTATFKSDNETMKGLGLKSGSTGKMLDVLIDPDSYETLMDKDGNVEVMFSVPYQDFRLVAIDRKMADAVYLEYGRSGKSGKMSLDSFDEPEEMSLNAPDSTEAATSGSETTNPAAQESLVDDFQPNTTGTFSVNLNANAQPQEFTDIDSHKLADDINFVNSWGLLAGNSDKKFSPDAPMTRGMLIMALAKLAGVDANSYKSSNFSDVPLKSELRPYAEWAYKKGIALGHGNWSFKPDEPVTREQMALFITKFAETAGIEMPASLGDSGPYNDHESISEWAAEAVYAIRPSGIIKEDEGFLFYPKRAVTKAEGASMLARLIRAIPNTNSQ